jgi:hypothetical protein
MHNEGYSTPYICHACYPVAKAGTVHHLLRNNPEYHLGSLYNTYRPFNALLLVRTRYAELQAAVAEYVRPTTLKNSMMNRRYGWKHTSSSINTQVSYTDADTHDTQNFSIRLFFRRIQRTHEKTLPGPRYMSPIFSKTCFLITWGSLGRPLDYQGKQCLIQTTGSAMKRLQR